MKQFSMIESTSTLESQPGNPKPRASMMKHLVAPNVFAATMFVCTRVLARPVTGSIALTGIAKKLYCAETAAEPPALVMSRKAVS